MPRQPPPQRAAHRDSQQNPHRHCRRHWLAHPSLQITAMKRPISWHIQCLKNMRSHCATKVEQYRREAESLDRGLKEIVELEAQIKRAQAEKLDAFDPEKFNRKRK
jgi:hypothetical protein